MRCSLILRARLQVYSTSKSNGNVSVMPYEYIDHDAIVSGSMTNLEKVLTGKLVPQVAIAEGKIKVEGNVDKVMLLAELMK